MEQVIKPFFSAAIPIYIYGINNSNIDKIEFIFKEAQYQQANEIAKKIYTKGVNNSEVVYDATNGYYIINLTPEDTAKFKTSLQDYTAWLDIQPQKIGINSEGELQINWVYPVDSVPITVYPSLYSEKILNKIYEGSEEGQK